MALDLERAWFGYEDHCGQPRTTITTGDTDADDVNASPVAHIARKPLFEAWETPSENEYFEFDFTVDVEIQALCVVFPRITNPYRVHETQEILPTDLIQHYLDADGGTPGTGAVFNSGEVACMALSNRGYHVMALQTSVNARYWRCNINAASRAAKGFLLVGLAMATPVFQPAFQHIFGDRIGMPDNAAKQRPPGSQTQYSTRNASTLRGSLVWDFLEDTEIDDWEAMAEYAGTTEPIIFARSNENATAVASVTGPAAHIMEGKRVFVATSEDDLSITSRQLKTNIKQVQLTEHR